MNKAKRNQLLHICAWCNQEIAENEDVYGFGANASQTIDLSDKEGQFISLNLALHDRTVFALVNASTNAAPSGDFDLLFITCSEDCARSLKDELDLERDVFKEA